MSCTSAIYTVNNTVSTVPINGNIPLGTTNRRFGKNLEQSGNGILVCGDGYYHTNCSLTLTPTAVGTVTATLYEDGVPVSGGTASTTVATANSSVNLNINAMTRLRCCDDTSTLTLVLTGVSAGITNVSLSVIKV